MMVGSIVLGGGCFWCTEAVFRRVPGIIKVTPGYAGGDRPDPTYDEVCRGDTGHAEVIRVEYDTDKISLRRILELFFMAHDPTQLDRQGNDIGTQYRSIIFYAADSEKRAAEAAIKSAQGEFDRPVVTQVQKLDKFYPAEDYHNDYYDRNRANPYCIFVIKPKLDKLKGKKKIN